MREREIEMRERSGYRERKKQKFPKGKMQIGRFKHRKKEMRE